MSTFRITEDQQKQINEWLKPIQEKVLAHQKKTMSPERFAELTMNGEFPYTGASGGDLTYSFTHTSLGLITRVKYNLTKDILDLTDYDSW